MIMLKENQIDILKDAFSEILGQPQKGTLAYVRCLMPEVVHCLCESGRFVISGWDVFGVVSESDGANRLITSDRAVELREDKGDAMLLLVDVSGAGAGMDGIYSAGREIKEGELLKKAIEIAQKQIPRGLKGFCKKAVSKARRFNGISLWQEFHFYSSCTDDEQIGRSLADILLWPIDLRNHPANEDDIEKSLILVHRLIKDSRSGNTIDEKIDSLLITEIRDDQKSALDEVVRLASTKPMGDALSTLKSHPEIWINNLKIGIFDQQEVIAIEIVSWRGKNNHPLAWSGLTLDNDQLVLKLNEQSKLTIRFKVMPETLPKDSAQFAVSIKAGAVQDVLAEKITSHSGIANYQSIAFTKDDFTLPEDGIYEAKVCVSVVGKPEIECESEDFIIRSGEIEDTKHESTAKTKRALIEGVIDIVDKDEFQDACTLVNKYSIDKKGYIVFRHNGKATKVSCPPLMARIDREWLGEIGRWIVKIRADGSIAEDLKFINIEIDNERLKKASVALSNLSKQYQGVIGLIHATEEVKKRTVEYINAWLSALDNLEGIKELALINTIEVRSISDKLIGLIVTPYHPIRIAWHSGYDNLLAYLRYEEDNKPKEIIGDCMALDSAYFPAFLPGLQEGESFVFADNLGFYFTAMVLDTDREPKASTSLLAKALCEGKEDIAPTIGKTTSQVLSEEILRYIELHKDYRTFLINGLRPGDGFTLGKTIGMVLSSLKEWDNPENDTMIDIDVAFLLNLYPAIEMKGITGRFFQSIAEKKRTGTGVSEEDRWVFEVITREGNISYPRLHWSKKDTPTPDEPAHLTIAFDTFESRVIADSLQARSVIESYGLHPSISRLFSFSPTPTWKTFIPYSLEGEKHPASTAFTDRIINIQNRLMQLTVLNINGSKETLPVLITEIPPEKEEIIASLHNLSDWVITIDKNAGIEYFDSPREKQKVFDAYIIDCVPEKEDLGFLQMVTSTANFDEVSVILDETLTEMALSSSPDNCLFLLNELKALSGRFALRLVGQAYKPQEMIALAITHANCVKADERDNKWLPLNKGFFIPIDEVPYLFSSDKDGNDRADLLYVCPLARGGFQFTFIEVKFRRNLRTARSLDVIDDIIRQLKGTRKNWQNIYGNNTLSIQRTIRYSRLARALRFYADKGLRHYLSERDHRLILKEIDRLLREGSRYNFPEQTTQDRGYIFCPEYNGNEPTEIYSDEDIIIYIIGTAQIPNRMMRQQMSDYKVPFVVTQPYTATDEQKDKTEKDEELDFTASEELKVDTVGDTSKLQTSVEQIDSSLDNDTITLLDEPEVSRNIEDTVLINIGSTNQDEDVYWHLSIKSNPHLLLVGLPGMGKTTSLINICIQLISQGVVPIVFSYHSDIDERLGALLEDRLKFIDYSGLGFNPMEVQAQTTTAFIDNVNMLRDTFSAIFPDLGDIQLGRIREALKQSYIDKGWDINRNDTFTLNVPSFQSFYDILQSIPKKDKALETLLIRLGELNDYGFFNTESTIGSIFGIYNPIIIRIHKTQNERLQNAFSMFILQYLYKQMFLRGIQRGITHAVIFDEAHRASRLKLIPTMIKECRKYGISFILSSQEARDFDASVYNGIANYLVLRINEGDAKTISKIIAPSEQINFYTDKIKQLKKYHGYFYGEGMQRPKLVKLRFI